MCLDTLIVRLLIANVSGFSSFFFSVSAKRCDLLRPIVAAAFHHLRRQHFGTSSLEWYRVYARFDLGLINISSIFSA